MGITPLQIKFISLILGPLWALLIMRLSYATFDRMTEFDTSEELQKGNIAVGIIMGSIFVGIGICVGLVTGFAIF